MRLLEASKKRLHGLHSNAAPEVHNPADPVSGFAGIPRNMTGVAEIMKGAGYSTHMIGKWDTGMATPQHTPWGRGYDTTLICETHSPPPHIHTYLLHLATDCHP